MRLRWYFLFFLVEIVLLGGLSQIQAVPGYMDADYYYATGTCLAKGDGYYEPFLWNYLDQPSGLPHPSHSYWMPLASLVVAAGEWMCGQQTFACARIPFILLAGLVPCLTAFTAYRLTGKTRLAIIAGWFAVVSGLYLPYLTTTDTFPLYMLLGTAFLWLMPSFYQGLTNRRGVVNLVFAGAAAGLLHLTRNDGLIWFAAGFLWLMLSGRFGREKVTSGAVFSAGYLLVMGPWMVRNLVTFGSLLAPGGGAALWLTEYDELYAVTVQDINYPNWVASGIGAILSARWDAFWWNIQTAWIVQGGIILAPFMVWGAVRLKQNQLVWLPLVVLAVLMGVMSIIFPYAGSRGGYLHAGAAVQPFLWALVPAGLEGFTAWGARLRGWKQEQALLVFATGLVVLLAAATGVLYFTRVIGPVPSQPIWNQGWNAYRTVEDVLVKEEISTDAVILVNNPPGFYAVTGRPAIAIPYGGEDQTLAVADRYGARFLVLDENNIRRLSDLYTHPLGHNRFHWIATVQGIHLFEIKP
jgi:hypothetical protein